MKHSTISLSDFLSTICILLFILFGYQMLDKAIYETDPDRIIQLTIAGSLSFFGGLTYALAESKSLNRQVVKRRSTAGYVYLLRTSSGLWKIGRTRHPADRLRTFAVKLPYEVEYECLIMTDDMYQLESELHHKFASKRKRGSEFFALTPDDVEYIKGIQ